MLSHPSFPFEKKNKEKTQNNSLSALFYRYKLSWLQSRCVCGVSPSSWQQEVETTVRGRSCRADRLGADRNIFLCMCAKQADKPGCSHSLPSVFSTLGNSICYIGSKWNHAGWRDQSGQVWNATCEHGHNIWLMTESTSLKLNLCLCHWTPGITVNHAATN